MNWEEVREVLAMGLNHYERKLNRRLVDALLKAFQVRLADLAVEWRHETSHGIVRHLVSFLKHRVVGLLEGILEIRKKYGEYARRYAKAISADDKERHILDFAREMGASPRRLRGDKASFSRWFGHDAITERYQRRQGITEREVSFALERLGVLAGHLITAEAETGGLAEAWEWLGLGRILKPFFAYDGDTRVSIAAFRCLSRALRAMPIEMQERSVDEAILQFIYRSAMHSRLDVWLQCEALGLLESLSEESLRKVLHHRLTKPTDGDDLFVRRRAVEILGRSLSRLPILAELLPPIARDPSPFVRQGFAAILPLLPEELAAAWLTVLATQDAAPQVRGAALLAALRLVDRQALQPHVLETLLACLAREEDTFVVRVATHVAAEGTEALIAAGDDFAEPWSRQLAAALERVHLESKAIPPRRWAAQALERMWCETHPEARTLAKALRPFLADMKEGERRRIPPGISWPREPAVAGRVLSMISQADFPYEVDCTFGRRSITRGHVFGFRSWRFLQEVRNPSPDKRQAFQHTIGRIFRGTTRAPSAILAELAETRVPGEPLFIAEEGGWRPYVPILDEVVSSVGNPLLNRPVHIYSSEGVTEIRPPSTLRARLRAFWKVTRGFAEIAKLRNWRSQLQESPASYTRALQELGVEVSFRPHLRGDGTSRQADPLVTRFFPVGIPIGFGDFCGRLKEYFFSVYDNSLPELAIFMAAATSYFVGRHLYANATVRACRRRMPLVVGGWGTRGKSGTERLKAALFNALGYGVVSKTTGCEAMFLCAHPYGKTREMFLFRSYDKATIWEQRNVLRLSDRLGADVFLWECMALTPSYVEVLQHHWVRDDISTITNTYPDHEDLQGPAGINIPQVIGIFIPQRSRAITSEEVMLPILTEIAKEQRTQLRRVTWIDAGLLAPDILKRFPYDEHPNNVALVLALADELGLSRDFTLKEMADRVVPDLGVLKTSPVSKVRTRKLQFSNGCSANERHGTLSNWVRCGFDVQDPVAEPGVWITTVVNNRADRVPRSRVFARILVEDIYADRHFLIGGNLTGLVGYVKQSWDAYAPTISLWPKDAPDDPAAVLREMSRRFRLPHAREHVVARLKAMVAGQGLAEDAAAVESLAWDPAALRERLRALGVQDNLEATMRHHEQALEAFADFEAFHAKLGNVNSADREALDAEFRTHLWKWFQKKLYVVHDYYASGEQIVNMITEETPPGYLNRVMGVQNIKGTGLDFVYRWQAWDACYRSCEALLSKDYLTAERGLRALSSFHEFGVLSREHVKATLEAARSAPAAQSESFQAELAVIGSNYEHAMKELEGKLKSVRKQSGRLEKVLTILENFFDAGDAVKRRKFANQVYDDLINCRVSIDRAALELQGLNKRQKGGWLIDKLAAVQGAVARIMSGLLMRRLKG